MALETLISSHEYFPGGAMAPEPIPFPFLANSEIRVTIVDAAGSESIGVQGVDYVIGGSGANGLATILALAPHPSSIRFVVERATEPKQKAVIRAQEPFPAQAAENQLDRMTMLLQELRRDVDSIAGRMFLRPRYEDVTGKYPIVLPGGIIGFSTGTGADAGLRLDLSMDYARFIGASGNETVQDGIDRASRITSLAVANTWTPGAVPALFGRTIIAAADHPTMPEIGHYTQLIQTVEPTGPAGSVYKAGSTALVKSYANSPELYGCNYIIDGKFGPGFGTGFVGEFDLNNWGAHADTIATSTSVYGIKAISAGTKRATALFWAAGDFDPAKPNYGFAATGYHNAASFYDSTNAPVGLDLRGAHSYGIDTRNAASLAYALMLKNNLPISGVKADGATVVSLARINPSNQMELADPNVGYIRAMQAIVPATDNSYSLGTGALRWGQIYSGNATISTSDERLKRNISPYADAELDALDEVEPLLFQMADAVAEKGGDARWHAGFIAQRLAAALRARGIDPATRAYWCADPAVEKVVEDVEVEEPEMIEEDQTVFEDVIEGDRVIRKPIVKKMRHMKMVEYPVHDADGNPIIRPAVPELRDKKGEIVREARPEQQETIAKVVMVKRTVPVEVERPLLDPETGDQVMRESLRYSELLSAMVAAHRRRFARIEQRLAQIETGA